MRLYRLQLQLQIVIQFLPVVEVTHHVYCHKEEENSHHQQSQLSRFLRSYDPLNHQGVLELVHHISFRRLEFEVILPLPILPYQSSSHIRYFLLDQLEGRDCLFLEMVFRASSSNNDLHKPVLSRTHCLIWLESHVLMIVGHENHVKFVFYYQIFQFPMNPSIEPTFVVVHDFTVSHTQQPSMVQEHLVLEILGLFQVLPECFHLAFIIHKHPVEIYRDEKGVFDVESEEVVVFLFSGSRVLKSVVEELELVELIVVAWEKQHWLRGEDSFHPLEVGISSFTVLVLKVVGEISQHDEQIRGVFLDEFDHLGSLLQVMIAEHHD